MKKKGIVDFIVPVGFMLIGVVSIIFAILCFTYAYPVADRGGYTWYEYYGGDAYTGIQHAAADTANNIYFLAGELEWYIYDLQTTNGYFLTIIGAVLIFFGLNKFFKVLKGNNKPQSITKGTVQSNTIETI